METTSIKIPTTSGPATQAEERDNKFLDRCLSVIPHNATLISARGVFGKGKRFATYTYLHAGRKFETTLTTQAL